MQRNNYPSSVLINERRYPIRTDFADWISILQIADDPTLTESEKLIMQMQIAFPKIPADIRAAAEQMHQFIAAGACEKRAGGNKRVVDFVQDWQYILAAFQQQYGLDLSPAPRWKFWARPMHWWKFMQLFRGLTEETLIVKIMGWRSINLAKIKDKELRKKYADLKRAYALAPAGMAGQKEYTQQELLEIANKKLIELKQAKAKQQAEA